MRWAAENGHVEVVQALLAWEGQGTLEGKRVVHMPETMTTMLATTTSLA